ncbi:hypothetical protein RRG08_057487 [Elysia crispata]|uniref:Uncharacterized protein n=1 Tax=Elysia crispata TaxID=231223 RepID=A0AAE1CNW2_9GAST|nr:hypothetical protein RRG08_057487 [Elysia crispata]
MKTIKTVALHPPKDPYTSNKEEKTWSLRGMRSLTHTLKPRDVPRIQSNRSRHQEPPTRSIPSPTSRAPSPEEPINTPHNPPQDHDARPTPHPSKATKNLIEDLSRTTNTENYKNNL